MTEITFPHSPAAEAGYLGSVLLDGTKAAEIDSSLFHELRNQNLAEILKAMATEGLPVDIFTVRQRIESLGKVGDVGGLEYLVALPDKTASHEQFDHWRSILQDQQTLRGIVLASTAAAEKAMEPGADAAEVLATLEADAFALSARANPEGESIAQAIRGIADELEVAHANPGALRGLPSGFNELDSLAGGFRPGQMIVIAARPGIGKTSLGLSITESLAVEHEVPVGFFSLEMTTRELTFRLLCSRAQVCSRKAQQGRLIDRERAALVSATSTIRNAPIHICDKAELSVPQLAARARGMQKRHGIALLVVDYLGLLRSGEKLKTRYEEVTAISNSVKRMAKELSIPVLVLAQLNRESEREERPPRLTDLRDTGAIEQDADLVGLLQQCGENDEEPQRVRLIIAKHRNGPTGKVDLLFHRQFTRFSS